VRIAGAQTARGEFAVFARQGWHKDQMTVVVYEGGREMTTRADVDSIWARLFRMELRAMGVEVRDHLA